jgi:bacillithiol biosynthesis cysteine-adding enzyme BshC
VRELLWDFPFGAEVASLIEESYRPGRTLGASFQHLLGRLLPDHGLLFLDPMQPALRAIAAPLVSDAVRAAPELTAELVARNGELEAAGYHAQVHFENKTSLFFLLAGGRRIALRRDSSSYLHAAGKIPAAALESMAEQLSPNALFRPVLQDYVLPTVAQIGGPAEIAYLAQTQVLYRHLGRRAPVVVPRAGFTLLDAHASRLMARHSLRIPHFYDGFEPLQRRISSALVPPELQASIRSARESVASSLDRLRADLSAFDPTLAAALDKSRAKMLYQLAKMDGKAARRALQQDQRAQAEALYLYSLVFPNDHLQERLYTILPFLAQHGTGLIGRIHDELHLDCPDHVILDV